jgi:hypothetical protein
VPFTVLSEQVAVWHSWLLHTALTQSEAIAQPWPSGQRIGHTWPQSTADSLPFFTPSLHVAALQIIEAQTPF